MDTNKKQNADKAVFDGSVLAISSIKTQFASSLGKDVGKITFTRGAGHAFPPNGIICVGLPFGFYSCPFAVVLTGLVPGNYRSDG